MKKDGIWRGVWASLLLGSVGFPASALDWKLDWSNTEIQYLHGDAYRQPKNPNDISRSIITFTHADGYALGRNFMFLDALISESGEPSHVALYGEIYSTLSLSKISGHSLRYGIVKDLGLTAGFNIGEKLTDDKLNPRVALYGATVDFDLPGFAFLNVDVLRHDPLEPDARIGASWQITPSWRLPFAVGNTHWSFEGFADFVTSQARQGALHPGPTADSAGFWGFVGHAQALVRRHRVPIFPQQVRHQGTDRKHATGLDPMEVLSVSAENGRSIVQGAGMARSVRIHSYPSH